MTIEGEEEAMARISRLSRWTRHAALAGCGVLVLLYALAIAFSTPEEFMRNNFLGPTLSYPITKNRTLWALGYFLALAPLVLYFMGLLAARRLLALYERGHVFSERAAVEITRIGWSVALIPAVSNGCVLLGAALLTWENAPGQRALNLGFGTGDVLALVYGILLIVIGSVLREAARMSDDYHRFV